MLRPRGAAVVIGQRDGSGTVGGAMPCGLRTCPNCGPIVQAERRQQIAECVDAARDQGWTVLFSTLTIGHSAEDRLEDLFGTVADCWRALTRGGWWNRLRKRFGLRHYIRVIECKEGGAHGWHPHLHVLLFLEPIEGAPLDASALGEALNTRWTETVAAAGYRANLAAQRLAVPSNQQLDVMAGYFSKEMGKELAWEMTDVGGKKSRRGSESVSPAELLLLAVNGDASARDHWREYEEVTKGRQMIAYSAGCRRDLRLEPNRESDEAVREHVEQVASEATALVSVSGEEWERKASHFGFREALLAVAAAAQQPEEVLWWLHDRGWRSARIVEPPQTPRGPREAVAGPPEAPWLAQPDEGGAF